MLVNREFNEQIVIYPGLCLVYMLASPGTFCRLDMSQAVEKSSSIWFNGDLDASEIDLVRSCAK